jgi:ribosome-binding protein aMBF1 (putative translation factor)
VSRKKLYLSLRINRGKGSHIAKIILEIHKIRGNIFLKFIEGAVRTKLIAARHSKNLSQQKLGRLIGRTQSAVAKYETQKCDIPSPILVKLHEVLGIPLADILYEEGNEESNVSVDKE